MRAAPLFAKLALSLALALSAARAHAEPTCPEGMTVIDGRCTLRVVGQVQRPQVFTLTGRGPLGWTSAQNRPIESARAVVDATRRRPF